MGLAASWCFSSKVEGPVSGPVTTLLLQKPLFLEEALGSLMKRDAHAH